MDLLELTFPSLVSEMPLQNTTNYRQHLAMKDLKKSIKGFYKNEKQQ